MTTADQGRAIFGILDLDRDRRLGAREVMRTVDRVMSWDGDGDGRVSADEIPYHFQVTIARSGLTGLTGEGVVTARRSVDGRNPSRRPAAGPDWFQKMDRNHDGDVSRREFLGPRDQFDRLDRDKDGLIDADEARGPWRQRRVARTRQPPKRRIGESVGPIEAMSATKSIVNLAIGRLIDSGQDQIARPTGRPTSTRSGSKGRKQTRSTIRHLLEPHQRASELANHAREIYASPDFVQLELAAELSDDPGSNVCVQQQSRESFGRRSSSTPRAKRMDIYIGNEIFEPLGIRDFQWTTGRAGQSPRHGGPADPSPLIWRRSGR